MAQPPMVIPAQLKPLTSFIRRAEELDRDTMNPDASVIAFYCRKYAMEKGIQMKLSGPEINAFLFSLMDTLETCKQTLQVNDDTGSITCENFAHSIFLKADDEDRSGNATKDTAKGFYTASTLFDILEQFGELDAETQEKRKYSKWKAADILNAIKKGVKPTPGAPGEDMMPVYTPSPVEASAPAMSPESPPEGADVPYHIPAAPTAAPVAVSLSNIPIAPFTAAPTPPPSYTAAAPPPVATTAAPAPRTIPPAAARVSEVPVGRSIASADVRVKDAIEYCSFAITALKHNEINLAKERLREALRMLE